jgi:hypothetical protein
VTIVKPKDKRDPERWRVTLAGLDVFDPVTMEMEHVVKELDATK